MQVIQPGTPAEARMVLEYAVNMAEENCLIRLIIGPSPRRIDLPADYCLRIGRGVALTEGEDAMLIAYGPVMLNEALIASESLAEKGFGLKVINMPWLNRVDRKWFFAEAAAFRNIFVIEDHAPVGGLCDILRRELYTQEEPCDKKIVQFAVEGYPACGTPPEVLQFHGLDGESIAERIKAMV